MLCLCSKLSHRVGELGLGRGCALRHLFQAVPAQQGPDDAALDHQDGDGGDQVGAQHHAPVGVVMRQQDREIKDVRASGESRLQEDPLQGILCISGQVLGLVKGHARTQCVLRWHDLKESLTG